MKPPRLETPVLHHDAVPPGARRSSPLVAQPGGGETADGEGEFSDEAPTVVKADNPLLPRPPRVPPG